MKSLKGCIIVGSLRGDLSLLGLADLFQLLASHQRVGMLTVTDASGQKSIYFGMDRLMLLAGGKRRTPRLGEILARSKRLNPMQIVQSAEMQKQLGIRFGDAVVKLGYLTQEDITRVVREQIEEEIYDLFTWEAAAFEFIEGPPPTLMQDTDQPVTVLNVDVMGFILEAMRRIDELQRIVKTLGGPEKIFALAKTVEELDISYEKAPLDWAVAHLIDGKRSISQIQEESRISSFKVYHALNGLHERKALKEVSAAEAGAPSGGAHAPSVPRTILVVGAETKERRDLCDFLAKEGYTVHETSTGREVHTMLEQHKPHAVIIEAPRSLEATWEMLQKLFIVAAAPMMVISPCHTREDIVHTMRAGARDYLVRPYRPQVLLERIKKLCEEGNRPRTETTIIRRAMEADG